MKVKDVMRHPVMTVDLADDAEVTWAEMVRRGIRHLIVLSRGKVVGVLSDVELGGERGVMSRRGQAVGELMRSDLVVVEPELPVAEAARLLEQKAISCLPVMEGSVLVGIVTAADLLNVIAHATG